MLTSVTVICVRARCPVNFLFHLFGRYQTIQHGGQTQTCDINNRSKLVYILCNVMIYALNSTMDSHRSSFKGLSSCVVFVCGKFHFDRFPHKQTPRYKICFKLDNFWKTVNGVFKSVIMLSAELLLYLLVKEVNY